MLDLKTLMSETAIDPEMTRVQASMRKEERDTAPEVYRPVFDTLSIRWGLVFVDEQIAVPSTYEEDSLKSYTSVIPEQPKCYRMRSFLVAGNAEGHRTKIKYCTACLSTGKNLKYHIPKSQNGKFKKLSEPGQKLQIDFTGKI